MIKNVVIGVLAAAAIAEMGFIVWKIPGERRVMGVQTSSRPAGGPPPFLTKGMKLAESPTAKFARQIYPGQLSDAAQAALTGWQIDSQPASDGAEIVTLTPTESDDQKQVYTVKTGQTLYFIEMTPADDKGNTDINLRDDYGVIVDSNGIVQ